MPKPPPFPIRIDDLTAELLTDALGEPVHDFRATRVGADRGMLGEIFRLELDGSATEGADGRAVTEVIAKFAALRDGSLASALRGRNYERELLCYEQLLARTPVRTPTCHGTWYDPETAHFLLLQESIASDPEPDQIAGLRGDQAQAVLGEVAQLHRRWWGDPQLRELDWLPSLDGPLRIENLTTLARIGWPQLVELLGARMPAVPAGFGDALPERLEASLRGIAGLPHTLLHCDLRADNLLFDPIDGEVTLVDWQGCGVGPAAFDVAYFIVQSLTIEERRAQESILVDHWFDRLTSPGIDGTSGPEIDREAALAGYAEALWYGLAIACALPVISDPGEPRVRDLAEAVVTRTLAALEDHRQLTA